MLRMIQHTFYGPKNEKFAHLPDVSFGLGIPRMILLMVLVVFGLYPTLMFDMIETASIPFINGLP
jgi:NADH-quinone oxidoreductase subunit M